VVACRCLGLRRRISLSLSKSIFNFSQANFSFRPSCWKFGSLSSDRRRFLNTFCVQLLNLLASQVFVLGRKRGL
jgi:hypothetical protein